MRFRSSGCETSRVRGRPPGRPTSHALSQTVETTPDPGVLAGRLADPDLRKRTPEQQPDCLYRATDQKVGGSNPSERANPEARHRALLTGLFRRPVPIRRARLGTPVGVGWNDDRGTRNA